MFKGHIEIDSNAKIHLKLAVKIMQFHAIVKILFRTVYARKETRVLHQ